MKVKFGLGSFLLLVFAIAILFNIIMQRHRMETIFLDKSQEQATVFLPRDFVFDGMFFRDEVAFHDLSFEAIMIARERSVDDDYFVTADAEYFSLFGDTTTFAFPEADEEHPVCPAFLIWNNVLFFPYSECTAYRVYG